MIVLMVLVGVALIAILIFCLVKKFYLKEKSGKTLKVNAKISGGHARYVKQGEWKTSVPSIVFRCCKLALVLMYVLAYLGCLSMISFGDQ